MSNPTRHARGASTISLLLGFTLLGLAVSGAVRILGLGLQVQDQMSRQQLVDQVNRISEAMAGHLNRGGSRKNPDVEARGIQICSLRPNLMNCNGYDSSEAGFCMSIPSRVSQGGRDIISVNGYRLQNGALAHRSLRDVDMAGFDHGSFCRDNGGWMNLNNPEDFRFSSVRFCRFSANTPQQVTRNFETDCDTIIENTPTQDMFWVAILKAHSGGEHNTGEYEGVRVVHLLNETRVRVGS